MIWMTLIVESHEMVNIFLWCERAAMSGNVSVFVC